MIQKEITMSYGIMKMPKYLPQTGLFGLFVAGMAVLCCTLWNTAPASAQGSEEIPFYKHTIDLGQSEAAEVADVNQDGKARHHFRRELV
jgi:hypothetical protein